MEVREKMQCIKIRERDPAHGILEAVGGHQAQSGTHRLGQGQTDRQTASRRSSRRKRLWEGSGQGTPGSCQAGAAWRTSQTFQAAFLKIRTQTAKMQHSELEGTLGLTQSKRSFQAEDTQAQKVTLVS